MAYKIKTSLKAPKGRKGDYDFEFFRESQKKGTPPPKRKLNRRGDGETNWVKKRVLKKGKPTDKGGQEYGINEFKKKGNVTKQRMESKRKFRGKKSEGESSFSSNTTQKEYGPKVKYKVKSSNTPEEIKAGIGAKPYEYWDSTTHDIKSEMVSKNKRRIWTGKNKQKKFKGKSATEYRVPKAERIQKRKLYGDWLKD